MPPWNLTTATATWAYRLPLAAEALAARLARSWDERVAEEHMVFASAHEEAACRRQADELGT